MQSIPTPLDDWQDWARLAQSMAVPAGVHAPSAFSATLAASLPDLTGQVVLDAGCGAGLVSIAALVRGAATVIACDLDPDALHATRDNVRRLLSAAGGETEGRLELLHSDFRALGGVRADFALANPPQRPASVLGATDPTQRHLHCGGGQDGLDTVRLLLEHLVCQRLWTTAAAVLPIASLTAPGWTPPQVVHRASVALHGAWAAAGVAPQETVAVWDFTRSS